jgi:hypothetical protein
MDNLTFDPDDVFRHGLTYIVLSRIRTKENINIQMQNINYIYHS